MSERFDTTAAHVAWMQVLRAGGRPALAAIAMAAAAEARWLLAFAARFHEAETFLWLDGRNLAMASAFQRVGNAANELSEALALVGELAVEQMKRGGADD